MPGQRGVALDGRCSVGVSVTNGFVTAGHCGTTGTTTTGFNRAAQGTFRGTAGYCRVRVHAYPGSGGYTLGLTNP
jgi:hypothetical protein